MGFFKWLTVAFSVGLIAKINSPVPASQVRFQQFRVIERHTFASKATASAVIVGHSGVIYNFYWSYISEWMWSFSILRKFINAFPFFPRNSGRRAPHKSISLGPRIS